MEFTAEQIRDILGRIEAELRKQGMTKQQFYEGSGISSSSFSQWNTGIRKPSINSFHKIADYLDVSYDYLIYGKEESNEEEELRQMLKDRPEAKILFGATKKATASAILEAAALLMKYQEESEGN